MSFLGFPKDFFRHHIQRIVWSKWSWISRNWERCFFIIGLYIKTSFIFYTSITGWENLKYLHRVCFQKFTVLLSKSSVSKLDLDEMEFNKRKIIHEFWWEHGQLQKPLSFCAPLSPSRIRRRGFKPIFLVVRIFIFVLCESWCVGHVWSLLEVVPQFVTNFDSRMSV